MNKIIPVLLGLVLIAVLVPSSAFAIAITSTDTLYSCGSSDGTDIDVHLRNKLTGSSISSNAWSISGLSNIQGCQGLSQDPNDFQWYALIEDSGSRFLASVDPSDGTGTLIGNTEDNTLASLVIDPSGVLFSIDGSDDIVTINKSTGASTVACDINEIIFPPMRIAYNYNEDVLLTLGAGNPVPTADIVEIITIGDPTGSPCGDTDDPNNSSVDSNMNPLQTTITTPFSWTYHTEDELFYQYFIDAFPSGNEYYGTIDGFINTKTGLPFYDHIILNANPLSNATAPSGNNLSPIDTITMGLQFAFLQPDTTPPVISAINGEPIQLNIGASFGIFDNVQCIDDIDGTIVPNGNFATVGGATVDIDERGEQFQDYTCTDAGTNTGLATIQYIINKASTGISSGTTSGSSQGLGGTSDVQTLDDIPAPTVSDIQAPTPTPFGDDGVETVSGLSISDIFANLFGNRLGAITGETVSEGVQDSQVGQQVSSSAGQPSTTGTSNQAGISIINAISNFFANIFG